MLGVTTGSPQTGVVNAQHNADNENGQGDEEDLANLEKQIADLYKTHEVKTRELRDATGDTSKRNSPSVAARTTDVVEKAINNRLPN